MRLPDWWYAMFGRQTARSVKLDPHQEAVAEEVRRRGRETHKLVEDVRADSGKRDALAPLLRRAMRGG